MSMGHRAIQLRRLFRLYQYPTSRPWFPLVESLLSLRCGHVQLRKAVQRSGEAEEPFQHRGEQERSASCKLVFVYLHVDAEAACEAHALLRYQACKVLAAADVNNTLDHVLRIGSAAHIIKSQDFLQRILALFDQRQVVEREV